MRCPACNHTNRDQARFCEACGTAPERRCRGCGEPLRPAARFCDSCGQPAEAAAAPRDPRVYTPNHLVKKVLSSRSALEGERKQVTVFFADVKGSLELAERVDAEEWHRIVDGFLGILAEGVHRFEGTVNQYTGDGVMALFGAPVAHEDHAIRAAYAALHLRDRLRSYADGLRLSHGLSFSARTGLHSGEVVVGKIGDDLRMDYTAKGHTVGLAARMEQLAEPGRVYLTGATAALIEGFFELRPIGALEVRGAREPVQVFELVAAGKARTRLDLSRARGFSRFVGRSAEIRTFDEALARADAGDAQILGVAGDAGIGKSRFCYELAERERLRGVTVREAHGLAHARNVPLYAVLGLLRAYFGLGAGEAAETARERIAGRVLRLAPQMAPSLSLLYEYLGVADPAEAALERDPQGRQRELWRVVRELLRARSRRELLIQILDDLHWFDPASHEFVAGLVDSMEGTRTLLIVNFRPPFRAAWMDRPSYHEIKLEPLGPAAIREMLADALGIDRSVGDLAERIAGRAGGNPFFVEEMVAGLVESGHLQGTRGGYRAVRAVESISIPPTVEAVIAGRIDRLGDREKLVLQNAAVIGREFSEPLLEAACDAAAGELDQPLAELVEGGMIEERSLYPEREYAFRHPLLHEVAYRSPLAERRQRTHAAVARALETGSGERLEERAGLIAHHRENAGETGSAARWHARAASWCELTHPDTAYQHWRKAVALLDRAPEAEREVSLLVRSLGRVLATGLRVGLLREEFREVLERGVGLCERAEPDARARFLADAGTALLLSGQLRESLDVVGKAEREALAAGNTALVYEARGQIAVALIMMARIPDAVERTIEWIAELDRTAPPGVIASALPRLALGAADALFMAGRLREARQIVMRAIATARAANPGALASALGALGRVEIVSGNAEAGLACAREAFEQAERTDNTPLAHISRVIEGWALTAAERYPEAVAVLESAIALMREHRTGLFVEALALTQLSRAHAARGDCDRALAIAEEAVAVAGSRETHVFEIMAELARVSARRLIEGEAAVAELERTLDRCLDIIRAHSLAFQEPWLWLERGELARLRGDESAARNAFEEAARLWTAMGATAYAARIGSRGGIG